MNVVRFEFEKLLAWGLVKDGVNRVAYMSGLQPSISGETNTPRVAPRALCLRLHPRLVSVRALPFFACLCSL